MALDFDGVPGLDPRIEPEPEPDSDEEPQPYTLRELLGEYGEAQEAEPGLFVGKRPGRWAT